MNNKISIPNDNKTNIKKVSDLANEMGRELINNLKNTRLEKGLTQYDVANIIGGQEQNISRTEHCFDKNIRIPSMMRILKILIALGLDINSIFNINNNTKEEFNISEIIKDETGYDIDKFTSEQFHLILDGLRFGYNITSFANPSNDIDKMHDKIIDNIQEKKNIKFNNAQRCELEDGLHEGVNILLYADDKYDDNQMEQIKLGLIENLDVSKYNNISFDFNQMEEIRLGLQDGLDVRSYADPSLDWSLMSNMRFDLRYRK